MLRRGEGSPSIVIYHRPPCRLVTISQISSDGCKHLQPPAYGAIEAAGQDVVGGKVPASRSTLGHPSLSPRLIASPAQEAIASRRFIRSTRFPRYPGQRCTNPSWQPEEQTSIGKELRAGNPKPDRLQSLSAPSAARTRQAPCLLLLEILVDWLADVPARQELVDSKFVRKVKAVASIISRSTDPP